MNIHGAVAEYFIWYKLLALLPCRTYDDLDPFPVFFLSSQHLTALITFIDCELMSRDASSSLIGGFWKDVEGVGNLIAEASIN